MLKLRLEASSSWWLDLAPPISRSNMVIHHPHPLLLLLTILLQLELLYISEIQAHDEIAPVEQFKKEHPKDAKELLRKMKQVKSDVYGGCGFIKACLKICAPEQPGCPTCIKEHDCRALVTIEYKSSSDQKYYDVKMLRKLTENSDYIALGVSTDKIMGADAIFACVTDQQAFNHFAAYSVDGSKNLEYAHDSEEGNGIPQDSFSKPRHTVVENLYLCEFRLKPQFTIKDLEFDLEEETYHLLGASGEARNLWALSGHSRSMNGRTFSAEKFNFKTVPQDPDYDESYDGAPDSRNGFSYMLVVVLSLILTAILN